MRAASQPLCFAAALLALPAAADTLLVANKSAATLTLVDAASAAVIAVLPTDTGPHEVDVSPDGRHVVVTNARSDTLGVYDAGEPALVREIRLAPERDEDAGWLGTMARILGLSDAPIPIGIQSAPGRLWIALANLERVIEIDTDTWTTVGTIDAGEEPDGMAWSPLAAKD